MLDITRLTLQDADFSAKFETWLAKNQFADNDVRESVEVIVNAVRERGDAALLELTQRYDQVTVQQVSELEITKAQMHAALKSIGVEQRSALDTAASRIRNYAEQQSMQSWSIKDDDGNEMGQVITAIEKVGVYVPGGTAAYPSSVLMNVIPAKVAGVDEIYMVVPAPKMRLSPALT